MKQIVFGDGKILITPCEQDGDVVIVLETNRGTGKIGELTKDADRQAGVSLDLDNLADSTVVLRFKNRASFDMLVSQAETCNFTEDE